jgi:hypothetical protein
MRPLPPRGRHGREETDVEIARCVAARYSSHLTAHLALRCTSMRHYVARGGTEEDFCPRLAPAFRHQYAKRLT